MNISEWYKENFETRISGRYIPLTLMQSLLEFYKTKFKISTIGTSVLGNDISMIQFGSGKKSVLMWSQMHGNETTTTKAVFDFLKFIDINKETEDVATFLKTYTIYCIPILNPDGAKNYSRYNANNIDLNRDAVNLTQPESKALRGVFNAISPALCLNLHDQRTIFGLDTKKPATVSFLAPAADKLRTITPSRKVAMKLIEDVASYLQGYIPGSVGRYDDTYNENCVGDTFQKLGVPTILFEAGHYNQDYQREKTRFFIFQAFMQLFGFKKNIISNDKLTYFKIPENKKNFRDVILRNVKHDSTIVSVAIQYEEALNNTKIIFKPKVDSVGDLSHLFGHKEIDVKNQEILINNQKNIKIGDEIKVIFNNTAKNVIII